MADESRKIILQLQIDQAKSLTDIVTMKDRIAKLKEEQKALNTETVEGKKTFEAYNASIKALTKEQRSLELAVEKTAAGFEFESGSIAANRAELSKLTAEYKNLANPTRAQTAKIKQLSDTLKEQEGAIGNTSRNVGNYKEALNGISGQLGAFGPQIQQITQGFGGVTKGLQLVSGGFKTLGGAIAATGFGLLLVLLAQLFSYFKNTDDGATKLEGVFGALGAVIKSITGFFAELGSGLIDIFDGTTSLEDALSSFGDFLKNQIENRINSFSVAIDALGKLMSGDFKGAAKQAFDAGVQLTYGITNATDKIGKYVAELAEAAKQAFDYAIKLDAINDAQRDLNITNAKNDQIVQQAIISAKNRTKTDQDRIEILLKANAIEEQSVLAQKNLDQQRLDLISARNLREQEAFNSKLARDLEEAKTEKEKAKIRKDAIQIADKQNQEEADLQEKLIRAETSFIILKEKNQNKIDALNDSIAADRKKAYDAFVAQLKEVNAQELNLENQRQARVISNLDYEISKTTDNANQKIILLRLKAEEEKNLQKKLLDDKLAQLTTESLQENANIEAINLEKIAAEEETNQNLLNIERKFQDDLIATNLAAEKKITDDKKKENEERKKQREQDFKETLQIINGLTSVFAAANAFALQNDIQKNEEARNKELQSSAKDKATQDKINKKYDNIAEKEKRKAARTDLDIKSVQAAAAAALGVVQALGGSAPPVNFILAALTAGAAAIEIATLQSQKAKLATGGLLNGPSHLNGGITGTGRFGNIEVEGGEFVVRKRAVTKETLPLLHHLNNMTINRPPIRSGKMASGGQIFDGGLSARQNLQEVQNSIMVKDLIATAIASQPAPVVLVKDINNGQRRKTEVTDRAKI